MFHCIREGRVILDHLHWEVQENEQWVILGLNGSGKTSLLNILLGYEYYLSETFQIDVHV
ncbi:molybdenum ABC transporter ATPase [Anoxybacillus flavithermus AK1]|uniref:Molybdenum ABC transporter ATPase n=1 Tax=Anoxybacillus flavithermus AK1 TaxID=1297581 RepID=M8DN96_9BACL|nr:molybdenum ABC transporter ATPase [Anoxybacillus flavithermus AK1]